MATSIRTHRLGQLFRLDLFTNKAKYISFLTGCFIANVCAQYVTFYPLIHNAGQYKVPSDTYGAQELHMYFILLSAFILLFGASSVAEIFVSKRSRTYWLTLPASNFEKFLVRLILWIPGIFLAHIAIFSIVDLLRQGFFALFSTSTPSGIAYVASSILCDTAQRIGHIATQDTSVPMGLSIKCMIIGFYLLGSTYFYKRAFIKTSVCLILLSILLNALGGIAWGILLYERNYLEGEIYSTGTVVFCGIVALSCLILAYRRFKRTTIIQPKFITLSLFRRHHEL